MRVCKIRSKVINGCFPSLPVHEKRASPFIKWDGDGDGDDKTIEKIQIGRIACAATQNGRFGWWWWSIRMIYRGCIQGVLKALVCVLRSMLYFFIGSYLKHQNYIFAKSMILRVDLQQRKIHYEMYTHAFIWAKISANTLCTISQAHQLFASVLIVLNKLYMGLISLERRREENNHTMCLL